MRLRTAPGGVSARFGVPVCGEVELSRGAVHGDAELDFFFACHVVDVEAGAVAEASLDDRVEKRGALVLMIPLTAVVARERGGGGERAGRYNQEKLNKTSVSCDEIQ